MVDSAQESHVTGAVVAPATKREPMVELQPPVLPAASSPCIDQPASTVVSFVHPPPHRRRKVPGLGDGRRLLERPAWSIRPAEAPGFQTFQLLAHRGFQKGGQVALSRGNEGLKALPLALEGRAQGDLQLVAAGRQGFERLSSSWGLSNGRP
jgi:hypothetical protein